MIGQIVGRDGELNKQIRLWHQDVINTSLFSGVTDVGFGD
jgi:hypothetical protein